MDANALAFSDESFEAVICVEAAFHFDTRETFLRECLRILKKGGTLALTDILLHKEGHNLLPLWPSCNFVSSLFDYQTLVRKVGFSSADVMDITESGWKSYARDTFSSLHDAWISGRIDFLSLQASLSWMYRLAAAQRYNLICFAVK
jgi:ubiquinone/menaquinone biosynthesis C-methylase UbiE